MLFAVVTYTCSIVHSIVCLCNMRTANYRDFREKKKKTFNQQKESKMEKNIYSEPQHKYYVHFTRSTGFSWYKKPNNHVILIFFVFWFCVYLIFIGCCGLESAYGTKEVIRSLSLVQSHTHTETSLREIFESKHKIKTL